MSVLEISKAFVAKAQKLVASNTSDLAYELCEDAIPVVQRAYRSADGNEKPFRVYAEKTRYGAALIAEGKDVVFREFGAGVTTATDKVSPKAEGLPPIEPASYSIEHAQLFYNNGYWKYKGKTYTGITPTLGLYNASEHIKSSMLQKAKDMMK